MPEFEVRLFNREGTLLSTVLTEAVNDREALVKAAAIAKKSGAPSFDMRQPLARRWVKRSRWT